MSGRRTAIQQLTELAARLVALPALGPITPDRVRSDTPFAAAVERRPQVALQLAVDVASWVIAERLWREPVSYRDTFAVLAEDAYV